MLKRYMLLVSFSTLSFTTMQHDDDYWVLMMVPVEQVILVPQCDAGGVVSWVPQWIGVPHTTSPRWVMDASMFDNLPWVMDASEDASMFEEPTEIQQRMVFRRNGRRMNFWEFRAYLNARRQQQQQRQQHQ